MIRYFKIAGAVLGAIIVAVIAVRFFLQRQDVTPITIDPTKHIEVSFTGIDRNGKVEKIKPNYQYDHEERRLVRVYESMKLSVDKDYELSNGDKVVVTVEYDPKIAIDNSVVVDRTTKSFVVDGLWERIPGEKNGRKIEIIQGIEVRSELFANDDAIEEYVRSQLKNNAESEKRKAEQAATPKGYKKGKGKETTHLKSKLFKRYQDAVNYGENSSQYYRIIKIPGYLEGEDKPKYRVLFYDEENKASDGAEEVANEKQTDAKDIKKEKSEEATKEQNQEKGQEKSE